MHGNQKIKYLVPMLTFLLALQPAVQANTKHVLFLGNSYTYVNNLPQLIADVATSTGDTLIFDSYTPGGYTLAQHAADTNAANKIMAGGWDYVVLQEQSQLPTFPGYFYDGVFDLCSLVQNYNPCARVLFYMTWGRKNGDASNCAVLPSVCTYHGMDSLLELTYIEMATIYHCEISPVGAVWKYTRENNPGIELYQPDESHPSIAGSYLAACSFYTTIFKKDPTLLSFNSTVNSADASFIRQAVKTVVFDSLSNWDKGIYIPVSDFNYRIGTGFNEVLFTNYSLFADSYLWDFGDSTSSTLINPDHQYQHDGTYVITLTTTNCDLGIIHQDTYQRTVNFCPHNPTIFPDSLMLCPNALDTLWTQSYNSYQWLNESGDTLPGQTNRYLVPVAGNVYCILATLNNCTEMSPPVYVGAYSNLSIYNIYTLGNLISTDTACEGDTLQLVLSPNKPPFTDIDQYIQWFKDSLPIPFSQTDTFAITTSGNYGVSLHHANCPDYILYANYNLPYTFINCNSGLPSYPVKPAISVYPNPTDGSFKVVIDSALINSGYKVVDMLGRLIQAGKLNKEINNLNLDAVNSGIYIFQIDHPDTFTIKLVKK